MEGVRNKMSGQASVVIQVRDIHGDVIVHGDGQGMPADALPLMVTASLEWAREQYGMHHVVAGPISRVAPGGDLREFIRWLADHEVKPSDNTRLKLLVEGVRPQAVVLTDLVIAVQARVPSGPPEGVELFSPQLFHKLEPRWFRADLRGGDRVSVVPNSARGQSGEFPYVVHQAEPEQFAVDLELGDQDVEWLAELHWTSAGRSGVLEISDRGKPFVSRSAAGRPRYDWDFDARRWSLGRPQNA
ncbi:hypothetical protein [Saccharothrix stipae]